MSLRINHNIMAMCAARNLYLTDIAFTKSLGKLSSGGRVNRAADDSAGLAISEKMRSQINGLSQAVRNSQDGPPIRPLLTAGKFRKRLTNWPNRTPRSQTLLSSILDGLSTMDCVMA